METYQIRMPNGDIFKVTGNKLDYKLDGFFVITKDDELAAVVPKDALIVKVKFLNQMTWRLNRNKNLGLFVYLRIFKYT